MNLNVFVHHFLFILLLLLSTNKINAHSHGHTQAHHDHNHSDHLTQFEKPPKSEAEAIARVLDIFHFAIDGEHEHFHEHGKYPEPIYRKIVRPKTYYNLVKNVGLAVANLRKKEAWAQIYKNMNLRRVFDDALKAYNIEAQHELNKDHVNNLILILPLSHLVEMVSGPLFFSLSPYMDLPFYITAGVGSFLTMSAIPGLDWLCLVIISNYPSRLVHAPLTAARKTGLFVSDYLAKKSGLINYIEREEAPRYLRKVPQEMNQASNILWSEVSLKGQKGRYSLDFFKDSPSPYLSIDFRQSRSTGQLSIKRIRGRLSSSELEETLKLFTNHFSPFGKLRWFSQSGYNLPRLFKKAKKMYAHEISALAKENFYIHDSKIDPHGFLDIEFENRAISLPNRYLLGKISCKRLFASP